MNRSLLREVAERSCVSSKVVSVVFASLNRTSVLELALRKTPQSREVASGCQA